jgi:type IV secretion system protein VirB2
MTAIDAAAHWFTALLIGPLVTALLVVAVAVFGMGMLSGRLSLRRGMEVVIGCFVLAGAAEIAGSMMQRAPGVGLSALPSAPVVVVEQALPPLGPDPAPRAPSGNPFDPYAGSKPVN